MAAGRSKPNGALDKERESRVPKSNPQSSSGDTDPPVRKIKLFGREFRLPRSRAFRLAIGIGLIVLGIFGFLPILGFWMIPLGLLVLSHEIAAVRRWRRRLVVWWERRKGTSTEGRAKPGS